LFAGAEHSQSRARNLPKVERSLNDFFLWPYDLDAAREFGRIYAHLRRTGRPMQQIDMQIAAVVLSLGNCTLVTADSDFAAIPGLIIEDWSK
jgi:tRNA(fMet)-specific endonuclease VapC